jgi:hypothetical protein
MCGLVQDHCLLSRSTVVALCWLALLGDERRPLLGKLISICCMFQLPFGLSGPVSPHLPPPFPRPSHTRSVNSCSHLAFSSTDNIRWTGRFSYD